MAAIEVKAVANSSNVAAIGYDAASQTLQVNFHNGGRYQYENVSPEKWAGLNQAESKGKYLFAQIKADPNCSCRKLEEGE